MVWWNPRISSSPSPNFWDRAGKGTRFKKKIGGFFGDRDGFDFELFGGSIPQNPPKTGIGTGIEPLKGMGILCGQGRVKIWGFSREKFPKILKKQGGDRGRILGYFVLASGEHLSNDGQLT